MSLGKLFRQGFIPAPAGNRTRCGRKWRLLPVHPRACGEQQHRQYIRTVITGSSPRLRGTGQPRAQSARINRFIPAPAGNRWRSIFAQIWDYGSSPRLRGTAPRSVPGMDVNRFIPAPAGNRLLRQCGLTSTAVHPRACGEQISWMTSPPWVYGSSPRLRGTVSPACRVDQPSRFIPAPAGNRKERESH